MKGFIEKVKLYSMIGTGLTAIFFGAYAYWSHIFMMPMLN